MDKNKLGKVMHKDRPDVDNGDNDFFEVSDLEVHSMLSNKQGFKPINNIN